jgi:hypothetical protein
MTKKIKRELRVLPLVQTHVVRPGRVRHFGSLCLALESIRTFVSYTEAIRIFEKTFHL